MRGGAKRCDRRARSRRACETARGAAEGPSDAAETARAAPPKSRPTPHGRPDDVIRPRLVWRYCEGLGTPREERATRKKKEA